MSETLSVIWKALFLLAGIIVLPWGLFTDSISRVIGGLGLILVAILINSHTN